MYRPALKVSVPWQNTPFIEEKMVRHGSNHDKTSMDIRKGVTKKLQNSGHSKTQSMVFLKGSRPARLCLVTLSVDVKSISLFFMNLTIPDFAHLYKRVCHFTL